MTKKELKQKMQSFIDSQNDSYKDEFYVSDKELAEIVLSSFAASVLGFDLDDEYTKA